MQPHQAIWQNLGVSRSRHWGNIQLMKTAIDTETKVISTNHSNIVILTLHARFQIYITHLLVLVSLWRTVNPIRLPSPPLWFCCQTWHTTINLLPVCIESELSQLPQYAVFLLSNNYMVFHNQQVFWHSIVQLSQYAIYTCSNVKARPGGGAM